VKDFIDTRSGSYGEALEVEYKRGAKPVLQLTDAQGGEEEVAIGGWKVDAISTFLDARLATAEGK